MRDIPSIFIANRPRESQSNETVEGDVRRSNPDRRHNEDDNGGAKQTVLLKTIGGWLPTDYDKT